MMGAFIIAPAHMHAQPIGRGVAQRMIQHLDMQLGAAQEFFDAAIAIHRLPAHGKIRRIDLQQQSRIRRWLRTRRASPRPQPRDNRPVTCSKSLGWNSAMTPGEAALMNASVGVSLRAGRLHVGDVGERRFHVLDADFAHAARSRVFRRSAQRGELLQYARELDQVLARARAACRRRSRSGGP